MKQLSDYGIDLAILQKMYAEWEAGTPKSTLEKRFLGRTASHGKLATSLFKRFLGKDTEEQHPLRREILRLRNLLERHGLDPDSA